MAELGVEGIRRKYQKEYNDLIRRYIRELVEAGTTYVGVKMEIMGLHLRHGRKR